ncbi:MAG: hypothetical protein ACLQA5_24330 [Solirubrobacteraceae bacterium]
MKALWKRLYTHQLDPQRTLAPAGWPLSRRAEALKVERDHI